MKTLDLGLLNFEIDGICDIKNTNTDLFKMSDGLKNINDIDNLITDNFQELYKKNKLIPEIGDTLEFYICPEKVNGMTVNMYLSIKISNIIFRYTRWKKRVIRIVANPLEIIGRLEYNQ